jgi:hypothetical protein
MLDALIKDMNLNFYAADNKTLFGVKYNTFRGWVTDPSSSRHRNPRTAVWNNFIYSLIAHRLGFKDTNAFLKLSMELPNEYGLSEGINQCLILSMMLTSTISFIQETTYSVIELAF